MDDHATTRRSRHGFAAMAASGAVLATALGFCGYASSVMRQRQGAGYVLHATFLSSSGLRDTADVVLAGVPVGRVTAIDLDTRTMAAQVTFTLDDAIRLPDDSRLSIGSGTLTGGNALMITPGRSRHLMAPGSTVGQTCSPASLEQQISQYIFGSSSGASSCGQEG